MANVVTVTLQGVDNLSNVITGAITKANVLGAAFQGAMGLANRAIDGVVSGIKSAGETQLDLIGLAGSMMGVLNVGYSESLSFSKALNSEFIKLGSQLPGTAEDFAMIGRSVADDVVRAFKDADENFSMDNAQSELVSLTRTWGLLAQQTGTLASDAGQNLTRLIAGDRMVLKQVMFDKSPAFKAALNQILKTNDLNLKDWANLTTKQRVEWIKQAADMTIPEAAIEQMSATVSGTLAGWRSLLFDPSVGAFGFLRELPSRFGETALDAFYGLLKGFERMATEIARLSPFDTDVMVVLFDAFSFIGSQFDRAAEWLKRFEALSDFTLPSVDVSSVIHNMISGVTDVIDNTVATARSLDLQPIVDRALSVVNQLLEGSLSAVPRLSTSLGSLAKLALGSITGMVVKAINFSIDNLPVITSGMSTMFNGLLDGLNSYLMDDLPRALGSLDYSGLVVNVTKSALMIGWVLVKSVAKLAIAINVAIIKSIGGIALNLPGIGSILKGVGWLFKSIGSGVIKVAETLGGWVFSADRKLFKAVQNLDKKIVGASMRLERKISIFFRGMVSGISSAVSGGTDVIMYLFSRLWDKAKKVWDSMINGLKSIDLSFIKNLVLDGIRGLFDRVKKAISGISVPNVVSGAGSAISSVTSGVTRTVGNAVSSVTNLFSNRSSATVGSEDPGLATQHIWGNSFRGNLKPLYDAIALERRHMPPGSQLTIANTSEAILNRSQISSLVNGGVMANRTNLSSMSRGATNRGGGSVQTPPPNITVNIDYSGNSGSELAETVINKLAEYYFSRKSF